MKSEIRCAKRRRETINAESSAIRGNDEHRRASKPDIWENIRKVKQISESLHLPTFSARSQFSHLTCGGMEFIGIRSCVNRKGAQGEVLLFAYWLSFHGTICRYSQLEIPGRLRNIQKQKLRFSQDSPSDLFHCIRRHWCFYCLRRYFALLDIYLMTMRFLIGIRIASKSNINNRIIKGHKSIWSLGRCIIRSSETHDMTLVPSRVQTGGTFRSTLSCFTSIGMVSFFNAY